MRSPGWRTIGTVIAVLGIGAWVVLAGFLEPAVRDQLNSWDLPSPQHGGQAYWPHDQSTLEFVGLAQGLRWAAILLGLGGVILLTRGAALRAAGAVGVAVWAGADVVLRETQAPRPAVVAVGCVALAALVPLVIRRGAWQAPPLPWVLGYVGVAAGVPVQVFFVGEPWMLQIVPAWMTVVAVATPVVLCIAATAMALAVAESTTPWGVLAAVAAGLVLCSTFVVTSRSDSQARAVVVLAVPLVFVPLLGAVEGSRQKPGWRLVGWVLVYPIVAVIASFEAIYIGLWASPQDALEPGLTLAGVVVGAQVGLYWSLVWQRHARQSRPPRAGITAPTQA